MNIWNTLPESYQQRVSKNTLAGVKCQIQQAENAMPAMGICTEAARVDNAILFAYLTSEVALEQPEIGRTYPNILMDDNCTDDKLHIGMPGCSGDYKDDGDESDERDDIPTASWRLNSKGLTWKAVMSTGMSARMATTKMQMRMRRKKHRKPMMDQRIMLRTEGMVGLTCEPAMSTAMSARMAMMRIRMRSKKHRKPMMDQRRMWRTEGIVLESVMIGQYISDVKYDDVETNAMASNVSEVKTVLQ